MHKVMTVPDGKHGMPYGYLLNKVFDLFNIECLEGISRTINHEYFDWKWVCQSNSGDQVQISTLQTNCTTRIADYRLGKNECVIVYKGYWNFSIESHSEILFSWGIYNVESLYEENKELKTEVKDLIRKFRSSMLKSRMSPRNSSMRMQLKVCS